SKTLVRDKRFQVCNEEVTRAKGDGPADLICALWKLGFGGERELGLVDCRAVEQLSGDRFAGADTEFLELFDLPDEIAGAFGQLLHRIAVALVSPADVVANDVHIGDETGELLVELGSSIHDFADIARLAFLLPEHVDDADDIEERSGPYEQDSLLVGIGPEFAVRLKGHEESRFDGNEHHDEVGGVNAGEL